MLSTKPKAGLNIQENLSISSRQKIDQAIPSPLCIVQGSQRPWYHSHHQAALAFRRVDPPVNCCWNRSWRDVLQSGDIPRRRVLRSPGAAWRAPGSLTAKQRIHHTQNPLREDSVQRSTCIDRSFRGRPEPIIAFDGTPPHLSGSDRPSVQRAYRHGIVRSAQPRAITALWCFILFQRKWASWAGPGQTSGTAAP